MISGGVVVPIDVDQVIAGGTVVVEDGYIVAVHSGDWRPEPGTPHTVIDASGCAVMPGLVNCHSHFRPFRGLGDGLSFMPWHDRYVHEFADRMTPEDAYFGGLNTFAEMMLAGITTVVGMSSITVVLPEEIQAAHDAGIRARLVPHASDRDHLEHTVEQIESRGGNESDRVRVWLGLEVPQLFDDDDLAFAANEMERLGVGLHTHLSEIEHDDITPLLRAGLVREGLSLAHCVYASPEDIARFASAGVAVSHNPGSNLRYGNGIAPVRSMLDAGVTVGLGTDAPDSTFSCDLLNEARLATLLGRATARDPQAISAPEGLALATSGGAAALQLPGLTGSLSVGSRADIIIVDLGGPHVAPVITSGEHVNVLPLLLFAARSADVRDVVVGGQVQVRDHRLENLDIETVTRECQLRATRILSTM